MRHTQDQFTVEEGLQLFCQSWQPQRKSVATLLIVHGFGDHSSRFDNIVQFMTPRGMTVYCYDQRGHGRSPGRRGHVEAFAQYRSDLHTYHNYVKNKHPHQPLFLLGQSMGGLIVLNYALHFPVGLSGVLAVSPHLSDPPVPAVLVKMSQLLSRLWPTCSFSINLETARLSRDATVVKEYETDPLVHDKASARLGTELAEAVAWTQNNAYSFEPPLLITHGDADTITSPEGSQQFFDAVQSPVKKRIVYDQGYHELHNDIHRERVLVDMAHWIESQLKIEAQRGQKSA